jgi:ribosomal protein S13
MRTIFIRIGFTTAAAQAIAEDQGLDNLAEVKLLTDDEIESLCKVLRRPGGTEPGVSAGAPPVPNPGIPVNLRAENHMKLLAFFLRHQERVSRVVHAPDITLESIRRYRDLRDYESTYKATTDDAPTINSKDWPKTMESLHEFLRSYLGNHKIPLAYVVRKNEAVPEVDPPDGYAAIQDEMIARARHYTLDADGNKVPDPTYVTSREKVREIIAKITRDLPCWTYVKPAQRLRDGRRACLGLYGHFLGPNNVDNMATMAEDKLKSTVYNGEQRCWDFEKYVNVHKSQHSIMEDLVEHGYTGIVSSMGIPA